MERISDCHWFLKMNDFHFSRTPHSKASIDKMLAREWMHANHKRLVTVKFGPEASIHCVDRKGQKLRTFNLKNVDGITVEKTSVSINTYTG